MNRITEKFSANPPKRVISLDVLRGIAVFMVIIAHVFIKLIDMSVLDPATGSVWVLIVFSPLIFLGKWKTFFLLISAAGNIYSLNKDLTKPLQTSKIFFKHIFKALILLAMAYVFKLILLPGATLDRFIFTGEWNIEPSIAGMAFSDTLEIIALSRIINTVIYIILTKISIFFTKTSKGDNQWKWHIGIYAAITLLTIFFSQVLRDFVFTVTGLTHYSIRHTTGLEGWVFVKRIILSWFFGHQEPLFPFVSSAFAGAIFGILLSRDHFSPQKFNKVTISISLGLIGLGLILMPFSPDLLADIWSHLHVSWLLLVNLGGQSLVIIWFINMIEFNSNKPQVIRRIRQLCYFRRFGLLSLTIYSYELVDLIPRWLFTNLFGIDLLTGKTGNVLLLFALVIVTLALWSGIILIWEKLHFWGSMESFLHMFAYVFQFKRPKKDPLHSKIYLYGVSPKSLLVEANVNP